MQDSRLSVLLGRGVVTRPLLMNDLIPIRSLVTLLRSCIKIPHWRWLCLFSAVVLNLWCFVAPFKTLSIPVAPSAAIKLSISISNRLKTKNKEILPRIVIEDQKKKRSSTQLEGYISQMLIEDQTQKNSTLKDKIENFFVQCPVTPCLMSGGPPLGTLGLVDIYNQRIQWSRIRRNAQQGWITGNSLRRCRFLQALKRNENWNEIDENLCNENVRTIQQLMSDAVRWQEDKLSAIKHDSSEFPSPYSLSNRIEIAWTFCLCDCQDMVWHKSIIINFEKG